VAGRHCQQYEAAIFLDGPFRELACPTLFLSQPLREGTGIPWVVERKLANPAIQFGLITIHRSLRGKTQ
jgi:hypothetical protein